MSKFSSKLKPEIISAIKSNKQLKNHLCMILDISPDTLKRWLKFNNPSLTRQDAVLLIAGYLGKEKEEITNLPEYQLQP